MPWLLFKGKERGEEWIGAGGRKQKRLLRWSEGADSLDPDMGEQPDLQSICWHKLLVDWLWGVREEG